VILESIVTTVDPAGQVNIAPMGPAVEEADAPHWRHFRLRPFASSQTFRNLCANRKAVVHVTDDAALFAQAAVETIPSEVALRDYVRRLDESPFYVLTNCCRWFAVEAQSIDDSGPRAEIDCRVIRAEVERPFFGFNRAKHAVIEAAILATRTHLISAESLRDQIDRLRTLVEKTGGASEHDAFRFLETTIHERLQQC
jgi:hypothetical protein